MHFIILLFDWWIVYFVVDYRTEGGVMTDKEEKRLDELMAAPYALPKRESRLLTKLLRKWKSEKIKQASILLSRSEIEKR